MPLSRSSPEPLLTDIALDYQGCKKDSICYPPETLSLDIDLPAASAADKPRALESATGRRAMRFIGGALDGTRRPTLKLPFTPTGSAAGQIDTLYIPTLGAAGNNKNLESFSLVNGMRGWGYRASGEIRSAPVVGGDVGERTGRGRWRDRDHGDLRAAVVAAFRG